MKDHRNRTAGSGWMMRLVSNLFLLYAPVNHRTKMSTENKWPTMDAVKGEFIVDKCEKVMDCVIHDREILQKKAHLLLILIGGVVTLALGAWLDPKRKLPPALENALGVEIVILLILGVLLIWTCLAPSDYASPGGEPKRLLQPEFANQDMPWMILGYCFLVQRSIDANLNANRRIATWLRIVGISIFASPLLAHVIGEFSQSSHQANDHKAELVQYDPLASYSAKESFHQERQFVKVLELPATIEAPIEPVLAAVD